MDGHCLLATDMDLAWLPAEVITATTVQVMQAPLRVAATITVHTADNHYISED